MTHQPKDDFDQLADAAAEMNAEDEAQGIVPHWSDDPRFESKEHYEAVMAGNAKLPPVNASQSVRSGDIDYHAAKGGYFAGLWNSGI